MRKVNRLCAFLCSALLSGLHTFAILTRAGVDANQVVGVDEQRHTDHGARFDGGFLQGIGGGVALFARLGVGHLQHGLHRHFGEKDGLGGSVDDDIHDIVFLHELHARDVVARNRNLVVGLGMHEDIVVSFLVEVLIRTVLNADILKLHANVETLFKHIAAQHVLQFDTHDSVALARLNMLEVNAEINLSIQTDGASNLNILT